MYYVFSVYYETKSQYFFSDFFTKSDSYPKKQRLKEVVKEIRKNESIEKIVILGITPMSEEEFNLYWN